MDSVILNIEHEEGDDNWVEYDYEVDVDYEPYDPGRCSGPPENCEPPSGGYADATGVRRRKTVREGKENKWEETEWSVFLEMYAAWRDCTATDRKSALEVAEEAIQELLYEACEEAAHDAYEAAMEAKGEAQREACYEDDEW